MKESINVAVRPLVLAVLGACLAFSPAALAVTPAPDGDYGLGNTAEGGQALNSLSSGSWNTAIGFQTLFDTNTGFSNTATGVKALFNNSNGANNTAYGVQSLFNNTGGDSNIAIGNQAGFNVTGDFNIDIGNTGLPGESNTVRIGTTNKQLDVFIAGIFGNTASSGSTVYITSDGHLGTLTSSARFKDQIKPMADSSEAILVLKPVTFRYKKDIDPAGMPQFGLIAEEVEKINPDLVVRDANGHVNSVRYEAINAMLLNEFLKEHRSFEQLKETVATQQATIAEQRSQLAAFAAGLKEQKAQIQKVSAQVAAGKPAPQLVDNH